MEELAKKKSVSMAQVSIAWMLSKDGVSAPIVGSTDLKNLEDIIGTPHCQVTAAAKRTLTCGVGVGALAVKLTEDEIKYLEEPYQPLRIAGHV